MANTLDFSELSGTWQRRLRPYYEYGSPFAPDNKRNFKTRLRINIWAFFLGIIYYFLIGIPKRGIGIALCSIFLTLVFLALGLDDIWFTGLSVGTQVMFSLMANFYYFIKVTEGRDSWDPLRDVRRA